MIDRKYLEKNRIFLREVSLVTGISIGHISKSLDGKVEPSDKFIKSLEIFEKIYDRDLTEIEMCNDFNLAYILSDIMKFIPSEEIKSSISRILTKMEKKNV